MHTDELRFLRSFTFLSLTATCAVWLAWYLFGRLTPGEQASYGTFWPQVIPWMAAVSFTITGVSATCFVTLRSLVRPLSSTVERFAEDGLTNRVIEELRADLTFYRFRYRNAKHDLERLRHERKIADLQARINAERRKLGIPVEPRPFDELH